MPNSDAERWVKAAEDDLRAARSLLKHHHYNLCAFHAQQAAEKALKGLLRQFDRESWGHSCLDLLTQLSMILTNQKIPEHLFESVRRLDQHYIRPRYPDAFSTGIPADYYNESLAKRILDDAVSVMEFVQRLIREDDEHDNDKDTSV